MLNSKGKEKFLEVLVKMIDQKENVSRYNFFDHPILKGTRGDMCGFEYNLEEDPYSIREFLKKKLYDDLLKEGRVSQTLFKTWFNNLNKSYRKLLMIELDKINGFNNTKDIAWFFFIAYKNEEKPFFKESNMGTTWLKIFEKYKEELRAKSEELRAEYNHEKLGTTVIAYRGYSGPYRFGYSWTFSKEQAKWFAERELSSNNDGVSWVIEAEIPKECIYFYFNAPKGEREITINPYGDINIISEEKIKPKIMTL